MYSTFRTSAVGHSRKKPRTSDRYSPIVYALLQSSMGKDKRTTVKVLLDSGASHTIVSKHCVRKLRRKKVSEAAWSTAAGTFSTNSKTVLNFQLPELAPSAEITTSAYVYEGKMHDYDIIVGRNSLNEVLLAYPNFNKPFKIHNDTCKYQLGVVIPQENKAIAFYSRKLNRA